MSFRKSKKEPMTDSSSNLNLNLYEPVSIINYQKRKCNRFLQKRAASRPGFRGFGPLILLSPRLRGKGGAVRHQRGPVQRVQKVMVGACGASFDKTAVHEQKSYSALSRRATVSMCMVWGNMSTGWTFLRV